MSVNDKEQEIVVSGEREAVIRTIEALKATIEELTQTIESISISLPKRQHRLLTGKAAEDLLIRTGCAVVPTKFEEPGDAVTIWGKSDDVGAALSAVYAVCCPPSSTLFTIITFVCPTASEISAHTAVPSPRAHRIRYPSPNLPHSFTISSYTFGFAPRCCRSRVLACALIQDWHCQCRLHWRQGCCRGRC